jgi:choline dehydrogenase-like flavoprotein
MPENTVAIVGSGIVGTTIAHLLTKKGHNVTIFEKGPEYPYPHAIQFSEKILFNYNNPVYQIPEDLKNLTLSGDYQYNLNHERDMLVGGSATRWTAYTIRMNPKDLKTKSIYGYGVDWPLTYSDIEQYYCKAETLLGVSGTDADNPFAPWRSKPYPLPPFNLSYDDVLLAKRLRDHGIVLHTTPQARTRVSYGDRAACVNFGTCIVCPIGARYSPNYHLQLAMETGLCKIHTSTSIRRIVVDRSGQARAIVYQHNDSSTESEQSARVIIVAGGAIESARLLLLSANDLHRDGIGNDGGHVGKHLLFHSMWIGLLNYKDYLYPGRFGGITAGSNQFLDPPKRGKYGGVKVEFPSNQVNPVHLGSSFKVWKILNQQMETHQTYQTGSQIIEKMKPMRHLRQIKFHGESVPSPRKYVVLSEKRDRFGDQFAHINYDSVEFDHETYQFVREIFNKFVVATGADKAELMDNNKYISGWHHMGTCRMGYDIGDSVTDQFGRVHGCSNLFVVGGSNFPNSGTVNPTLTMVALAIRTAEYISDQIL